MNILITHRKIMSATLCHKFPERKKKKGEKGRRKGRAASSTRFSFHRGKKKLGLMIPIIWRKKEGKERRKAA